MVATNSLGQVTQIGQLESFNEYNDLEFRINGTGGTYTYLKLMYSGNVFFESAEKDILISFNISKLDVNFDLGYFAREDHAQYSMDQNSTLEISGRMETDDAEGIYPGINQTLKTIMLYQYDDATGNWVEGAEINITYTAVILGIYTENGFCPIDVDHIGIDDYLFEITLDTHTIGNMPIPPQTLTCGIFGQRLL